MLSERVIMDTATDGRGVTPVDDEVSLIAIANSLLRNWRLIVLLPILLSTVVGAWTYTRGRSFVASASFVAHDAANRSVSTASALAQEFGVSLGTARAGESPEFYAELLHSTALLRKAVLTKYDVRSGKDGVWRGTLLDRVPSDGGAAAPVWLAATQRLEKNIETSVSRSTGVVQLTVAATDPGLAEQIAARLLALLNDFNVDARQRAAQQEASFISGRIAETQSELTEAENRLQNFLRRNREVSNSPQLLFERERMERRVSMLQEVYTSLARSQEQARIEAARDVPLLTIIDRPEGTAEPRGRGTVQRAIMAFALGFALAVFLTFVIEFSRRGRRSRDPHYLEFETLVRGIWKDVRHPRRWFSPLPRR